MTPAEVIARTLYAENRNHGLAGIRIVADSIWNRARKRDDKSVLWVSTLTSVCLEHRQYSCWNSGKLWAMPIPGSGSDRVAWDQCWLVASDMLSGRYRPDGRHTHYCNVECSPAWEKGMEKTGEACGMKMFVEA
jgi:hypothetical protein